MRPKIILIFFLIFVSLIPASFAQQQDSLIIFGYDVFHTGFFYLPVYAVTFDSVCSFNLPFRWSTPNGWGHLDAPITFLPPLNSWDLLSDSLDFNQQTLWLRGQSDIGGDTNPPLFTNGQRLLLMILRFTIEPNAPPGMPYCIDTALSESSSQFWLGSCDTLQDIADIFVPGCLYYGLPNSIDDDTPADTPFSVRSTVSSFDGQPAISFTVNSDIYITITIYDQLGRKIKKLADNYFAAGNYALVFDGRDDYGNNLSSGIYFYSFTAGDYSESAKILFIK